MMANSQQDRDMSQYTDLLFTHEQGKLRPLQVVWLGIGARIEESTIITNLRQNLLEINNDIRYFSSEAECFQYIEKNVVTILLVCPVISVPIFHSQNHTFNHIHSIYVYSTSREDGKAYFPEFSVTNCEVKGPYTNAEDLSKDLYLAAESLTFCPIFCSFDKTQNTTEDFGSWWTGFIDLLCHLKYPNGYFKRLIYTLKVYYRATPKSEAKLRALDELEADYQAENAVWWYTRPKFTFLVSILNQALRQRNIELLFLFGIFIQDIYKTLKVTSEKNKVNSEESETPSKTVYRSQIMSKEEIDRLKSSSSKYLSVNCFLSTSSEISVAEMFSDPNNSQQVFLRIDYDPRLSSRPYADIGVLSRIGDEQEVLFMPGVEFEKLNILHDNCWKVHLTLRCYSFRQLRYENSDRNLKNDVFWLKRFLPSFTTGPNDVDIVFSKLIEIFPNEQGWLSAVKWNIVGSDQEWKLENYPLAIDSYSKAIQLWKEFGEADIDAVNEIAKIYHQLGYCYQKLAETNHNQSKTYSERVIKHPAATYCDRVDSLNRLSEIFMTKSKICRSDEINDNRVKAIDYKRNVLEKISTENSYTGYEISACLEQLGQLYESTNQYHKAVDNYEEAIHRCSQESERNLPTLIHLHRRVANIYLKVLREYPQAIEHHLKIHRYMLEKYELKPEIREPSDIKFNMIQLMESSVELADVYLEAKIYSLATKTLNDTSLLYADAEPKSENIKKIIEDIRHKLERIPSD